MIPDAVLVMFSVRAGRNGIESGNEYCTFIVTMLPVFLHVASGAHTTPVGNPAQVVVTVINDGLIAG
jgi:hypothetical protein